MITDHFGNLLIDLSKILKIKDLHPDEHSTCRIKFPTGVSVNLELDRSGNNLVIGIDLGNVPPGRYRENVFREALKANGLPPPQTGIFAYSKQSDRLVLIEQLPLLDLNAEKIAAALTPLLEKAKLWQDSLTRGDIPTILPGTYSPRTGAGMFGLK